MRLNLRVRDGTMVFAVIITVKIRFGRTHALLPIGPILRQKRGCQRQIGWILVCCIPAVQCKSLPFEFEWLVLYRMILAPQISFHILLVLHSDLPTRYFEMIFIFYSTNTFHISYVPTLFLFPKSVPPERLAAIKSLDFAYRLGTNEHPTVSKKAKTDYDNMWAVLRSFSGLRSLRVAIRTEDWRAMAPPSGQGLLLIRESWLSPVEQFKHLERFELAVAQRLKECLEPAFADSSHRLLTL
jgi:hypothetical protein